MEDLKTGAKCETRVAAEVAKNPLKEASKRNSEGTLLFEWKCPYFSDKYCVTKGNKDYRSKQCFMYGQLKELRDGIVKKIEREAIALEMASKANESKSTWESLLVLFTFVCLLT